MGPRHAEGRFRRWLRRAQLLRQSTRTECGEARIYVYAVEADGTAQPRDGAGNAMHVVRIVVT